MQDEKNCGDRMKTKHTPAPWDVRKIDTAVGFRGVFGICSNLGGGSIGGEEAANHRLISAAPEMLAALKMMLVHAETFAHGKHHGIYADHGASMLRDILIKVEG